MKTKRIIPALLAGLLTASAIVTSAILPAAADAENTPKFVKVAQPVTNIVGDIALIREINSKNELDAMTGAQKLPATALYTVNQSLQALDKDGQPFATLDEILAAHNYKILPAFRVSDKATADALTVYLKELGFYDCMLVSADTALMKELRDALPSAFGVIDYTETYKNETTLTTEQCLDIRRSMKTYGGNVAILPAHLCREDTVQYLYERQVNVWTQISDTPTAAEQYDALLSGAVGVISDATDSLLDIACHKLEKDTMTRTPLNVGHRGIPSKAPECTVEGSLLAYENSANVVEMDVFLTADGHVAVMHDITTGDTCNGNLNMEESTLAQLKELYVNKGWENSSKYSQLRIPTLNEYMDAFKDTDCMLFIEIKSHQEEIVPLIRDMVNEYGMYDRCTVITFNTDTMEHMRKHWPEMSLGVLIEGWYYFMGGANPEEDLRQVMDFAGPHNGTVNPPWEDFNKQEIRAFLLRGISVNPWTFYGNDEYRSHFLDGFASLTGNDANVMKRLSTGILYKPAQSEVETGDSISLNLNVTSYDRYARDHAPNSVTVLEGEDLVQIDGDTMTFTGETGRVTFVLRYADRALGYSLYTQPVTVTIKTREDTETTDVNETDETDETTNLATDGTEAPRSDGCASSVSALAVIILPAAVLVLRKRKDD